jgi:hypothetical protein
MQTYIKIYIHHTNTHTHTHTHKHQCGIWTCQAAMADMPISWRLHEVRITCDLPKDETVDIPRHTHTTKNHIYALRLRDSCRATYSIMPADPRQKHNNVMPNINDSDSERMKNKYCQTESCRATYSLHAIDKGMSDLDLDSDSDLDSSKQNHRIETNHVTASQEALERVYPVAAETDETHAKHTIDSDTKHSKPYSESESDKSHSDIEAARISAGIKPAYEEMARAHPSSDAAHSRRATSSTSKQRGANVPHSGSTNSDSGPAEKRTTPTNAGERHKDKHAAPALIDTQKERQRNEQAQDVSGSESDRWSKSGNGARRPVGASSSGSDSDNKVVKSEQRVKLDQRAADSVERGRRNLKDSKRLTFGDIVMCLALVVFSVAGSLWICRERFFR